MRKMLVRSILIGVACTLMLMAVPLSAQPQGTPFVVLTIDPDHPDEPDEKLIEWNALPDATHYQVASGDLTLLRESQGDFTESTENCVEDNLTMTFTEAKGDPDPGQGFWYLVRGVNNDGNGTYDSGGSSQIGLRDAEMAASDEDCSDD